jgi:hypothetical protein
MALLMIKMRLGMKDELNVGLDGCQGCLDSWGGFRGLPSSLSINCLDVDMKVSCIMAVLMVKMRVDKKVDLAVD